MPGEILVYSLRFFLVFITVLIIIIEAYVLKRLKYDTLWRSLALSLLTNAISTVLSYLAAALIIDETKWLLYVPLHFGFMITIPLFGSKGPVFSTFPVILQFLAISYFVSILSEGPILHLLGKKRSTKTIWRTTLATNSISHVFLFVFYLIVFINRIVDR